MQTRRSREPGTGRPPPADMFARTAGRESDNPTVTPCVRRDSALFALAVERYLLHRADAAGWCACCGEGGCPPGATAAEVIRAAGAEPAAYARPAVHGRSAPHDRSAVDDRHGVSAACGVGAARGAAILAPRYPAPSVSRRRPSPRPLTWRAAS